MRKIALIALAAGTLCPVAALAQSDLMPGVPLQAWGPEHVLNHPQGGYNSRVPVAMWDSGLASETGGGFAGPGADAVGVIRVIGDDIVPSAAAGLAGGYSITGIRFGAWVAVGNTVDVADHRFTIYPTFNEAADPVYSGTPIEEIVVAVGGHVGASGQGFFFPAYIAITGGVTFPAFTHGFAYHDVVDDADLPTPTVVTGINGIRRANGTMPAGGGNIRGYFSANGSTVMNSTNYTGAGPYPTNWRASFLSLQVDAVVTAPTPDHDMTCVADGTTTHSFNLASGDAYWIALCLNGNAVDGEYKFCDIDSEGSGNAVDIAIFDSTGALVGRDVVGSGSGTNAQMSFGVGRRAAVGDGVQYDGRSSLANAVAGLAAGNYLIAVAPAGSSFSAGWAVTAAAGGGATTINVNTNVNGGSIAPSVPPAVFADLGQLVAPGAPVPTTAVGAYEIKWYKFNTCFNSSDAEPISIDMSGSTTTSSTAQYLFNSAGNLVAFSTFGAGGTAPAIVFDSTNVLPAGDYYLAHTYQGVALAPSNDRWHLRSTNGSNGFTMGGQVLVNYAACTAPCDGDVNCDFALDGFDVETQEKAVGGDTTDYCQPDPDFNGDFALDGFDVEAVEVVTGGGPCP